ncbi:MAG TPA: DsbC family protein [Gammaproteobacteria bacterium]|nr:DsbC family protein [Gammaproteobacteria bacterium]
MNIRWIVLPLGLLASAAWADGAPLTKEQIAAKLNNVSPSDITESPLPGVYQVKAGSSVAYVSADGRYFIEGDIYDLSTSENLTEDTRAQARAALLSGVSRDDMIVFTPKDGKVKHTITMFTDIDCGYCRQFHRDIDKVTALGIEVHYLFYPRTGPNTESWTKAEEVWCAKDRKSALTKAKLGGALPKSTCADNPVEEHWELGREVGVRGTPAIFAENGELLGGYLTPDELEKRLEGEAKPN